MKIALIFMLSQISYAYTLKDYAYTYKQALKNKKKIIIQIGASYCPSCQEYKKKFITSNFMTHNQKASTYFLNLDFENLKKSFNSNDVPKSCELNPSKVDEKIWKERLFYCLKMYKNPSLPIFIIIDPQKNSVYNFSEKPNTLSPSISGYKESSSFKEKLANRFLKALFIEKKPISYKELKK